MNQSQINALRKTYMSMFNHRDREAARIGHTYSDLVGSGYVDLNDHGAQAAVTRTMQRLHGESLATVFALSREVGTLVRETMREDSTGADAFL